MSDLRKLSSDPRWATKKVVLWPYYVDVPVTTGEGDDAVTTTVQRLAGFELEYTTGDRRPNRQGSCSARGRTTARCRRHVFQGRASGRRLRRDRTDGRVRIPLQGGVHVGSFYMTEEQLHDLGIEVPTLFQLYSWKDMAEDMVKSVRRLGRLHRQAGPFRCAATPTAASRPSARP